MAPRRTRPLRMLASAALVAAIVTGYWAFMADYLPRTSEEPGGRLLFTAAVSDVGLFVAPVVAGGAVVALLVWSVRGRSAWRPHPAIPAAGLGCVPVAWGFIVVGLAFGRTSFAGMPPATDAHGVTYRGGYSDSVAYLLRDVDTDGEVWTGEVLAARVAIGLGGTSRTVRPEGAGEHTMHALPTGGVYWIGRGGAVVVGWAPDARPDPRLEDLPHPYRGARDTTGLPPFGLLGPDDTASAADVAEIERLVSERRAREDAAAAARVAKPRRLIPEPAPPPPPPDGAWTPFEHDLLDALHSENPSIRAAAERWVRAGGESLYPEASARLARGPR